MPCSASTPKAKQITNTSAETEMTSTSMPQSSSSTAVGIGMSGSGKTPSTKAVSNMGILKKQNIRSCKISDIPACPPPPVSKYNVVVPYPLHQGHIILSGE